MENLPPSVGFDVITRSEMSGNLVKSPAQGGLITDTVPGSLERITAIVQNVDSQSVQVALNSERFTDVRTTEKVLVKRAAPSGVMSEEVVCCILTTNTAKRGRGTLSGRRIRTGRSPKK